jgi:hypothetical protein
MYLRLQLSEPGSAVGRAVENVSNRRGTRLAVILGEK